MTIGTEVLRRAFRSGRQGALWQAKASVGPYDGLFSNCRGESSIQVSPRRRQHATSVGDKRHLVYAEHAPSDYDHSAVVYNEVISVEEEANLVADLQEIFRRRRYENGHWDAVIVKYKETELFNEAEQLSATSQSLLERVRQHLATQGHASPEVNPWLPSHAIELHPEGELRAHIDSVRYSGGLVAGLSLGASSIMRLQPPKDEAVAAPGNDSSKVDDINTQGFVDLLLHPRSLYALTGNSRYAYTHELLAGENVFGGTGEVVRRDALRWSVIFRDAKPTEG